MNIEWLQFVLGVLVFVGGCLGVAIRIGYIVANTVSKITLETDSKIGRVYERFDKYKDQMEVNFVRKESCGLTHTNSDHAFATLVNAVEKLNDKVDTLLMRSK